MRPYESSSKKIIASAVPNPRSRVQRLVFLLCAIAITILILDSLPPYQIPRQVHDSFDTAVHFHHGSESKYAFAAFLAAPVEEDKSNPDSDVYFTATRMLVYQFLHDPHTRTNTSIPFVVLATTDVEEHKIQRLRRDGAIVKVVDKISVDWVHSLRLHDRWRDMFTKLRLLELYEYERVLYVDSDMLIAQRMDNIFYDPAAQLHYNLNQTDQVAEDESTQPSSYVFAGVSGQGHGEHGWPPRKGHTCSGGFILFRPSLDLFNHYLNVSSIEGRFDARYMEQNLWNYVHRREGNLPWQQLDPTWNVNWPRLSDYKNGAGSMHTKWWDDGQEQGMKALLLKSKWKMEATAEARDRIAALGRG